MNIMCISLICILVVLGLVVSYALDTNERKKQLERYLRIPLGMPEPEMLQIMGEGYNGSVLRDGRKMYEWHINETNAFPGNISSRWYSGVKKVSIYVKSGVVEEVSPYNG